MAQMKEQIKTPEKELSKMGIANRSDAEFKTLVIRMLRELTEYGKCIKKLRHTKSNKENSTRNQQ